MIGGHVQLPQARAEVASFRLIESILALIQELRVTNANVRELAQAAGHLAALAEAEINARPVAVVPAKGEGK
jgi:hypothetical protein